MAFHSILFERTEDSIKKETLERHGLIGKLVEPYPKPIRKKQERHYLNDSASLFALK
ncbi:hypothetical protein Psfp_00375 [Pelotomaculum sp. FP]|uniref:hypothetical protein n=1 Tax=Pelotomaculum sp. FP TaxID=261474 RepID=UPI00110210DA|nr:hypothetical protein [Pelotomaculum sp. FP]TEB17503.1 hypothetical protein Psfp_00375 [Pelotomaculum sp. FP]